MKKPFKIALITIGSLICIYFFLAFSWFLRICSTQSTANEPGIQMDSKFLVSNLLNYENGDFICYEFSDKIVGKSLRVHRLLGKPNDVVELRNGILYINDKNMDASFNLKHSYLVEPEKYRELLKKGIVTMYDLSYNEEEKLVVNLIDEIAKKNGLSGQRVIAPRNQGIQEIKAVFNQPWNFDNFGPLKIPPDKYFVVGDNRNQSADSRIVGFIDASSIIGKILFN